MSQQEEPETLYLDEIEGFHDHLVNDLRSFGQKFVDSFTLSVGNGDREYTFRDGSKLPMESLIYTRDDGCTRVIHSLVYLVNEPSTGVDLRTAATALIKYLVRNDETMISARDARGLNILDLAVGGPDNQELIETICEHGMVRSLEDGMIPRPRITNPGVPSRVPPRKLDVGKGRAIAIYVEWQDLLDVGKDSCLHLAIRNNQEAYARYLLDRIALTGDQETVLAHFGAEGLTPLHVAVDSRHCSSARIKLASRIIDEYPRALSISSATMQSVALHERVKTKARSPAGNVPMQLQTGGGRIKEALAPYKYFLETAEGAPVRPQRRDHRQQTADNPRIAVEGMRNLLRISCMRHHGQDRALITRLLDTQKQIHLDLNPRTQVTQSLLGYMAAIKFEPYLQYVYIPRLSVVDVRNDRLESEDWWDSHSRKDYAYIFWWLWTTRDVQRIFSIVVEDDQANPHSDEVIENSVKMFDVEKWDWRKPDICSDTLVAAAKNVRKLSLYWSGNRAVLKSWAAPDGLAELQKLETVRIMAPESMESNKRTGQTITDFENALQKSWLAKWKGERPAPKVTIELLTSHEHIAQLSEAKKREREEKGRKERWLRCTEDFVQTLKKYMNNKKVGPESHIKVAIVDDGIDADKDEIGKHIHDGETFYDNKGHWPGFYQSTHGHGHYMACLIRQLCPNVHLYIAKLNELWVDGKSQITAESAAKAIDWAREQKVDIISMSWTMEDPAESSLDDFRDAVVRALDDDILMFCASNDKGGLTNQVPYPARFDEKKIFRIGSATALGQLDGQTQQNVMFIAPGGSDEEAAVAQRQQQQQQYPAGTMNATSGVSSDDLGFASPRRGSSIATARCAGLAALILQCVMLRHPTCPKAQVRRPDIMQGMFQRLTKEKEGDANGGKYLRVWGVFENAKQSAQLGKDLERDIVHNAAHQFVHTISLTDARAMGLHSDSGGLVNGS